MRLLLLRHGQTPSNVSGALDTAVPGPPLTALGQRQARGASGTLVATYGADLDIAVSDLIRTHETAAPFASETATTPLVLGGLREIQAGAVELRTDEDAVRTYHHTVGSWMEGRLEVRMPGGEDGHEFLARYDEAIGRLTSDTLVVSHGAAIRTWVACRAAAAAAHHAARESLRNTGCITLDGEPGGRWEIVDWQPQPIGGPSVYGDTAHDPTGEAED